MTLKRLINRTRPVALAAGIAGSMALALPGGSAAAPNNGGGGDPFDPPGNFPPSASLVVNPNPAVAGYSPRLPFTAEPVTFNSSFSSDVDGSIVRRDFDLNGNGIYELINAPATVSRRYYSTGTITVRVKVYDNRGASRVASKQLVLHRRPVARLIASPDVALVGDPVEVDAGLSTDDGSIVKYEFDLDGNGSYETDNGNNPKTVRSFGQIGEHTLKVRVTDNHGAKSARSFDVRVHRAPTAAFAVAPSPAYADEQIMLDGQGSTDDGSIARYEWDLDGDGAYENDTAADPRAQLTVDEPGDITLRLRVTDNDGAIDEVARTLTVEERPAEVVDNQAPFTLISRFPARVARNGVLGIRIACPRSERLCVGLFGLRAKVRSAGYPWLGIRPFVLGGGEITTVQMRLSRRNHILAYRAGLLPVRAYALARDEAGNRGLATTDFRIRGR